MDHRKICGWFRSSPPEKERGPLPAVLGESRQGIGDDVKPGEVMSFPQAVKLEPDETVVFAWIVYESREHRDRVNAAVMKDPRMADMVPKTTPFDGMRMFWGGFEVLFVL